MNAARFPSHVAWIVIGCRRLSVAQSCGEDNEPKVQLPAFPGAQGVGHLRPAVHCKQTTIQMRWKAFNTAAWSMWKRDKAAARAWINTTSVFSTDEKRVLIRQFDEW